MGRIGMAARLLDLKGDATGAAKVLRDVLTDPAIEQHLPEKVEALVFLAEIHCHNGERQQAGDYLRQLEALDLARVEPDLVDLHLRRAGELRAALASSGG
jgi:hypothetical protein